MLFPMAVGGLFAVIGSIAILDLAGAWNVDWSLVLGAMVVATGVLVAAGAATGRAVGAVVVLGVVLLAALAVALAVRVPLFALLIRSGLLATPSTGRKRSVPWR